MSDKDIEQEIQAKGKIAPRIKPEDIEANIVSEIYFTADEGFAGAEAAGNGEHQKIGYLAPAGALRLLTFCVLVLRNGFTVTGESACASPENFDAEIGRKIARQNAVQKIWPLMGYELRTLLALSNGEPGEFSHGDLVLHVYKEEDLEGLTPQEREALLDGKYS